jgi:L-asparaginase II/GrpB-like predicted nucleotidyltransferase (UPF0157 family)
MDAIRVTVARGGTVEARHRVHAAAVREGRLVDAAGSADLVCFLRSSAKPLQALPLVRARPDLGDAEIAIACASHRAEPAQIAAVRSLLAAAPASDDDLECGEQEGRPPGAIHHNCSGKHAGFLAVCRAQDWDTLGYGDADHPLQRMLAEQVAAAAELAVEDVPTGIDGCGVVTFAMTLERMATAFSRLPEIDGAERVLAAMRARPELVGGEGSLDTLVMSGRPGWMAKGGAEGLLCGIAPDGTGFALKCEDGNSRALQPALAQFLGVELGPVLIESSPGDMTGVIGVDPEDVAAYEIRLARGRVGAPSKRLEGPIEIAEYDPAWPGLYKREETRLRAALGNRIVRLEHAGSTSVPELPAKPIIDIVLEVADTADEDAYVPDLEAAGYVLRLREPDWRAHRLFKGPDTNVNLHVFPAGCEETDRMLLFRDHLRRDEADRAHYARTKRELATRNWTYLQQYADAKTAIVCEIMARAEGGAQ